ncbi:type I-E CRISPR-associated endoribonuclease Cas2e [Aerococcaceae bacterium WGS1372]
MPLTVITLKKVPASLRGDLTKWMQEIAQGVYVGNFNKKIREQLWERVTQNVATGEATMSYAYRNEIGYQFETFNTDRKVIDYDGVPLVMLRAPDTVNEDSNLNYGFSNASKFRKARKYSTNKVQTKEAKLLNYVVVDIETTGLDYKACDIIEIGAVKVESGEISKFQKLINIGKEIPETITELTGITHGLLDSKGVRVSDALNEFVEFVGDFDIVDYGIDYDVTFLNETLKKLDQKVLTNKVYDLMRFVKKEKLFLSDYKLQTALGGYEISDKVTHRALEDAELIYQLSIKVNKFLNLIKDK